MDWYGLLRFLAGRRNDYASATDAVRLTHQYQRSLALKDVYRQLSGQEEGLLLGYNQVAGEAVPVIISLQSLLATNLVFGAPGAGKSVMLLLYLLCMALRLSPLLLILIDPHGSLARALFQRLDMSSAAPSLLYMDFLGPVVFGLTPLTPDDPDPSLALSELAEHLSRLHDQLVFTPKQRDALFLLGRLLHAGGLTLTEFPRLADPAVRQYCFSCCAQDDELIQAVEDMFRVRAGNPDTPFHALLYKLRELLYREPRLQAVFGTRRRLEWNEVVQRPGVVLVNTAMATQQESRLVSGIVFGQIRQALARRTHHLPTMLVIDEFQRLLTSSEDITVMVEEFRKRQVHLTAACQHVSQIPPRIFESLLNAQKNLFTLQAADHSSAVALARQLYAPSPVPMPWPRGKAPSLWNSASDLEHALRSLQPREVIFRQRGQPPTIFTTPDLPPAPELSGGEAAWDQRIYDHMLSKGAQRLTDIEQELAERKAWLREVSGQSEAQHAPSPAKKAPSRSRRVKPASPMPTVQEDDDDNLWA